MTPRHVQSVNVFLQILDLQWKPYIMKVITMCQLETERKLKLLLSTVSDWVAG